MQLGSVLGTDGSVYKEPGDSKVFNSTLVLY